MAQFRNQASHSRSHSESCKRCRLCIGSPSLCWVIPWGLQDILQEKSHRVQMQIRGCSPWTLHSLLPSVLCCFPSCHWDILSLCSPSWAWNTQNRPKWSWTSWQPLLPQASEVMDYMCALLSVSSMKIAKWAKFVSRLLLTSLQCFITVPQYFWAMRYP